MKLLILAGGKGTRLRKEVPDVPKAMAPINGKPFLDYQMENWLIQGVESFVFILHYEADIIKDHLSSQYPILFKKNLIEFVIDPYPLDTGGAVANAVKELNISGKFLVTNADTWLGTGLSDLWKSDSPSLGVINVSNISRFGKVNFDKGKITSFEEKNNKSEEGYINAGIFFFDAINFNSCNQKIFSLERDFLPSLVAKGKLDAVILDTDFIDIGVPSDYNHFCLWMKSKKTNKL